MKLLAEIADGFLNYRLHFIGSQVFFYTVFREELGVDHIADGGREPLLTSGNDARSEGKSVTCDILRFSRAKKHPDCQPVCKIADDHSDQRTCD